MGYGSKLATDASQVESSVIESGCRGGFGSGIAVAFLLFLILILLAIGFSIWF